MAGEPVEWLRTGRGFPDIGDGRGFGACAGMGEAVEIFDGPQDVVVIDPLVIAASLDHGPDEDRGNPVVLFLVILVPGHDEQTVVLLRPLDIGFQVVLQPSIASLNCLRILSMVHVVDLVRHDDADGWEAAEIGWEGCHGLVGRRRKPMGLAVLPIHPGIMFARIVPGDADQGADRGEVLRIACECQACL